ncbi:hypothetical protein MPER_11027 [Moniliophthora perniciosa FA553]|nr:hypothetical protein MPER_11027 [Moniliophthora perniciosa FA553]
MKDKSVFRKRRDEALISEYHIEKFRAATASLRFHTLPVDEPEWKYLSQVQDFAQKYVYPSDRIWYSVENMANNIFDATFWKANASSNTEKEALVSVRIVPEDSICWKDFLFPAEGGHPDYIFRCAKNRSSLEGVHCLWKRNEAKYVLLTDERHAAIFSGFIHEPGSCLFAKLSHFRIGKKCLYDVFLE